MDHPQYVGFEPRAFFSDEDVVLLEPDVRCVYLMLLVRQMLTGTLPEDPETIRRTLGVDPSFWPDCWEAFGHLFEPIEKGRIGHPRMHVEYHRAANACSGAIERARNAGKASGAARRALSNSRSNGRSSESEPVLNEEKEENEENEEKKQPSGAPGGAPSQLDIDTRDVMQSFEQLMGRPLPAKKYAANAEQARLLLANGTRSDPKEPDAPILPARRKPEVLAVLAWLRTQPDASPKDAFSWRPQIQSMGKLRQKWPKLVRAMAESSMAPRDLPKAPFGI